jgi:hypothetical protein
MGGGGFGSGTRIRSKFPDPDPTKRSRSNKKVRIRQKGPDPTKRSGSDRILNTAYVMLTEPHQHDAAPQYCLLWLNGCGDFCFKTGLTGVKQSFFAYRCISNCKLTVP